MFKGLTEIVQISLLATAIRDHDKVGLMFENMIQSYLDHDLVGQMIWATDHGAGGDARHRENFEVRFLDRCDELMVDRL